MPILNALSCGADPTGYSVHSAIWSSISLSSHTKYFEIEIHKPATWRYAIGNGGNAKYETGYSQS